MINVRTIPAIVSLALVVGGCEADPSSYEQPEHSAAAIRDRAEAHLTSTGTTVGNYDLEGLSFDYLNRRWTLMYSGKTLLIGNHFAVRLSDEDPEKIEVVKGL